uniref:Uncharacterized protein n=1 Tax=Podoviridae sp. ctsUe5 TaxID=2827750 RepID=A0A8S5S5S9_9CAUD|nr:MAG TPA: hypothetical protein [Podoviridae sp. ctsUe5]
MRLSYLKAVRNHRQYGRHSNLVVQLHYLPPNLLKEVTYANRKRK